MSLRVNFYQSYTRKDSDVPLMVGGDFNMIIYDHEKNSGLDYTIWMDMFKSFINDIALIEIFRGGSRFTWTNK
jgi:hypothetical protein